MIPLPSSRSAPWWSRRHGTPVWDGILRGTALVAAAASAAALRWDDAGVLAAFALITVWVHGPFSALLPAAYEPTLLFFGQLYAPLLIATIGTVCNLFVEFLNYHMFLRVSELPVARRVTGGHTFRRAVALFAQRPFFAVWLFAWSPLPFWVVRLLAPAARYPVPRYLLATLLGRFPRFWVLATLGARLKVPGPVLLSVVAASTLLSVVALLWRRRAGPALGVPAALPSTSPAV